MTAPNIEGLAADRRTLREDGPLRICVLGAATSAHVITRARAFASRGHHVTLISPVPPADSRTGLEIASPVFGGFASPIRKAALLVWCAWAVLRARAQVYHAHYAGEIVAWMAWLLRKRPLVVSVMGGDVLFEEQGTLGPIGRWLTRRTIRAADYVTVKTPQLADVVAGFGVARNRIDVVIWGVDTVAFTFTSSGRRTIREQLGTDGERPMVFSPRMLQPFYNIHLLVEAWPAVLREVPNALLAVSTYRADPNYQDGLKAQARALGIEESILWAPALPQDEMAAAYSAADVVVSIPPSDGFPQAVLEAAACGRPVVLSNLKRLHGLLAPDIDALYTATDPASLAATIVIAITDHEASAARAACALAKVKRHADFEANVSHVEARLHQLAARLD